jgi:hypothetical protein
VVIGAAALGTGCYAHARAEPAVFVEAEYEPVRVETYPRYVYEGRTVYYVRDRWYTRDGDRWVYYRVEPETLRRQRVYVQSAPPAPERRRKHRHDRDRDRDHDRSRDERRFHSAPPAHQH